MSPFKFVKNPEISTASIPILQMKTLRHKEEKVLGVGDGDAKVQTGMFKSLWSYPSS